MRFEGFGEELDEIIETNEDGLRNNLRIGGYKETLTSITILYYLKQNVHISV